MPIKSGGISEYYEGLVVSDDELRWLRWFGPRHVDGELVTESRQWLWMLLDWVLALALAGWLATRRRSPS